ncbi:hypothetical protein QFZ99_000871 [Paraburkholderia atlantica]|uniref:hypothetical protein n=1 Tax=Paraburkholderia atlantica TaxID=2654982 RepID=UPI003D233BC7
MNEWTARFIALLRAVDMPLDADDRVLLAQHFERGELALAERTDALQRIGHIVRAHTGTDLVQELPMIVAKLVGRLDELEKRT